MERKDLLLLYNDIDISLDTFPYSGGTTSFEASYMGVPLLTLKGNNFLENCGVSINHNINMENWIAENKEEYVKKPVTVKFESAREEYDFIIKQLEENERFL